MGKLGFAAQEDFPTTGPSIKHGILQAWGSSLSGFPWDGFGEGVESLIMNSYFLG